MKLKFIPILSAAFGLAVLSSQETKAQNYVVDAFRISQPSIGGTTRSLSIGGAQNSLGGDIGTLNANPAGLGFYRRSDFAFTGNFHINNLETTYLGNKLQTNNQQDYNVENIGIVFAHSSPLADRSRATDNKVVSFAFGAGYTRLNNLNLTTNFSGNNLGANFSSNLAELGTNYGITGNSFGAQVAGIAYDEYLINPTSAGASSYVGIPGGGGNTAGVIQNGLYQESGYNDQGNFSLGMNFGNVVYLGAGVNFENYNYYRYTDFIESGLKDPNNYVDGLEYNKSTYQNGTGIDGKLGIIFNFLNVLHVGGYVQTPTNYDVNESVDFSLLGTKGNQYIYPSVNYNNSQAGTYDPQVSSLYEFHLKTPFKYDGGASLILGNYGFISADVEYLNYKEMSFSSGDANYDKTINSAIQTKYKDVLNYKAGAELKFGPLVLRGGYAFYPTYLNDPTTVADQQVFSGGIGIHTSRFYIDFGGIRDYSRNYRQAYSFADGTGPIVKNYNIRDTGTITIGTRF